MLMRLQELHCESMPRMVMLADMHPEPEVLKLTFKEPLALKSDSYFTPEKLHPKHQNNNKYRFKKSYK